MDKTAHYKGKNKKQPAAKPKTAKKRTSKSDGPTCSMFLADLTRKFAARRRQEVETPKNIVQTIVDSITNALPIKLSRRTPTKSPSPIKIETLLTLSPELLPNDTISIPYAIPSETEDVIMQEVATVTTADKGGFKMPKMPIVSSEVMKAALEKRKKSMLSDAETTTDRDMASEIAKHVSTLRRISLIAEEFNQKTAKNLKEIVDSVQEDLIKKLEEIQAEQKAKALAQAQALELLQSEQASNE